MANKRFLMGILVMTLVFGMALVGCDDGLTSKTDPALNGTWVSGAEEYKFNNGSFEFSDRSPCMKGTFTTSNNSMTMTITQIYSGYPGFNFEDKTKWYSKADLKGYVPDEELDNFFTPKTGTYSISGNNLTLNGFWFIGTFTKK